MNRICPYSLAGEPTECYENECMAWHDGECSKFTSESLSLYFIAKNLKTISESMRRMDDDDLR